MNQNALVISKSNLEQKMLQDKNSGSHEPNMQNDSDRASSGQNNRSRRKFVVSATAAPVLMTVAGRSALACQTVPKGLSFAAWCSVNPKGKSTQSTCVSHTVSGHTPCKPPYAWTPKKTGTCFEVAWPDHPECKPFTSCKQRYTDRRGKTAYRDKSWAGPSGTYQDMCHHFTETSLTDAGWNTGTKLSWLDGSRSIAKILIDESRVPGSTGNKAEFCAAWLNAHKYPGTYALKPEHVRELCTTGKIGTGGYVLTPEECKAFLEQTRA